MSTRKVTVQEASPSPPPSLPKEPLPSTSTAIATTSAETPVDEPITSLGGEGSDDDDDDEDDEWDPSEERIPGRESDRAGKDKVKGKGKEIMKEKTAEGGEDGKEEEKAHPWQAVWSAEKNAWYFWNTTTSEVTWTNPLDPSSSTSSSDPPLPPGPAPAPTSSSLTPHQPPLPAQKQFGIVPEIDPALAFLLPPEARGGPSDPTAQSAMFNARTGRFTANDYMYNVEHLDEYNRMKRMNNQYFDQDAWERDMALHNAKKRKEAEEGVAPKPLSKKEMDRFRKMKQEKRKRNQAWLRD